MNQKGHKIDQKGWNIWIKGFWTKNTCFFVIFYPKFWYPPPPKQKLVCQTKLGVTICICKNPDSFEIIRKIGSHLEKNSQFWNHPENWQSSGKIRTALKLSAKLVIIWKSLDSFEIIWKIGSHLEKSGKFWNDPENWQSSRKIRTVLKSAIF